MSYDCFPRCKPCRQGDCINKPKQEQWKPDRLSGKILKCGHRCDMLPTVRGIVDMKGHCIASHVKCDTCGEFQPIRWQDQAPETPEANISEPLVIPF